MVRDMGLNIIKQKIMILKLQGRRKRGGRGGCCPPNIFDFNTLPLRLPPNNFNFLKLLPLQKVRLCADPA